MRVPIARFPLVTGAAILLLTTWPYIAGYRASTPERRFIGFFENETDANPYVSWVRQSAEGHVFLESLYSPEPVPAHLFNLMTFVLGTAARVTGLSPIAMYHGGRIVFGALLLAALWWAAGVFIRERTTRRFAFIWMSIGAGTGWLFVLVKGPGFLDPPRPLDLRIPEAFTFYSILTFPHLAASMALLVVALVAFHLGIVRNRFRWYVVAAVAAVLLGGFHPYPLITIAGTVALYAGVVAFSARRRGVLGGAALVLSAAAAGFAWNAFMFSRDPVLAGWKAQNVTLSLHPLQYLLGLSPALWLLPWAMVYLWRGPRDVPPGSNDRRDALVFLACWILVTLATIYMPVSFQRRLIEGITVPLVMVACMAIGAWRQKSRRLPPALVFGLLLAISAPTSALLVTRSLERAKRLAPEWHVSSDELAALAWLRANAGHGSVVLAGTDLSNRIPRFTDCRVFRGHWCQTREAPRRAQQQQIFFSAPVADRERAGFLAAERIEWLVCGPAEMKGGAFDPRVSPLLDETFRAGEVAVYRVRR